ncbi:MAG: hypothetical protein QOG35_2654 [Solirubrobacteraceae bacterium]|jgi:hypothetical protein|nr:hypothetical protein [Solirubrobacteraceae bacterium]
MSLANADQLAEVLTERSLLGRVFARHAYGMGAWVDLFSVRVAEVDDPHIKALMARLVADNARHMLLFRTRAAAYGVDPDAYACPPEGEAIYERIPELRGIEELAGYALGSLDHFAELLAVYRSAAEKHEDRATIEAVAADVAAMRDELRPLAGDGGPMAAEAHERYRQRELVETPRYAHAG